MILSGGPERQLGELWSDVFARLGTGQACRFQRGGEFGERTPDPMLVALGFGVSGGAGASVLNRARERREAGLNGAQGARELTADVPVTSGVLYALRGVEELAGMVVQLVPKAPPQPPPSIRGDGGSRDGVRPDLVSAEGSSLSLKHAYCRSRRSMTKVCERSNAVRSKLRITKGNQSRCRASSVPPGTMTSAVSEKRIKSFAWRSPSLRLPSAAPFVTAGGARLGR